MKLLRTLAVLITLGPLLSLCAAPRDAEVITVGFDANGGRVATTSVMVVKGAAVGELPVPSVRVDYNFLGWYTAASGGMRVTEKTVLNESVTLYAHWVATSGTFYTDTLTFTIETNTLNETQSYRDVTYVYVPRWVTRISDSAFRQIPPTLTSITIPGSVVHIGNRTFATFANIKDMTIPQYVLDAQVKTLFPKTCSSITNIVIAEGTTSIGPTPFLSCSGLKSVTIPNTVTNVSRFAFMSCSTVSRVYAPSRLRSKLEADRVFQWCSADLQVVYYDACDWLMVNFAANGGENDTDLLLESIDKMCIRGEAIGTLPPISTSGFQGWFTAPKGGTRVTENTIVEESVTLYGHWPLPNLSVYFYFDNLEAISAIRNGVPVPSLEFSVPANDDGTYTTDITLKVKEGFELSKVMTNGVEVAEAAGKTGLWTFSVTNLTMPPNYLMVIAYARPVSFPFPDIGLDADSDAVSTALTGVADDRVIANITNAAQYADYRLWVLGVTNETVLAQTIRDSKQAWLSYALGSDSLLEKNLVFGDMNIESISQRQVDDKLELVVGIKDVNIGGLTSSDETQEENLRKVFTLIGGTSLDAFSTNTVDTLSVKAKGGKVEFVTTPKNKDVETLFIKVRLAQ